MEKIVLAANAKLNLSLDITGVREDGYHTLDTVMHSVRLYDELTIKKTDGEFTLSSNVGFLPTDGRNVVYKAAGALAQRCGLPMFPVDIYIKKRIPTRAGLGGGSADAAAALVGLNKLFELGLSRAELAETGGAVGADIPFCVIGGCARVTGIGEIVSPLEPLRRGCFVVAMPKYGCSTREAFARYSDGRTLSRPDTEAMLAAVAAGDLRAVGKAAKNVFEQLVDAPDTGRIKARLCAGGARGASMSGSGAAVFGLFDNRRLACASRDALAATLFRCFAADPAPEGVRIISAE